MERADECLSFSDFELISSIGSLDYFILTEFIDRLNPYQKQRGGRLSVDNRSAEQRVTSSRWHKIAAIKQLSWKNSSPEKIARAEAKILSSLKSSWQGCFINILNDTQKIWTVMLNLNSNNVPVVLLHGFGGGIALWIATLDELCANRPVYAIDLPGFAQSTRPTFSTDPNQAEEQFVDMIEQWRIGVGLNEDFIIIGHSFGGFLSASYAIRYPKYVRQIFLVDPWGFGHKPDDWQKSPMLRIPPYLRSFSGVLKNLTPFSGMRASGPFGVFMIKRFRSDLRIKFERLFNDDRVLQYIYHCNAQKPSGEDGFRAICDMFSWAKNPMIDRIHLIDDRVPIHFIHGGQSWVEMSPSILISQRRKSVFIEVIEEAGHHVYTDTPDAFISYLKLTLLNRE